MRALVIAARMQPSEQLQRFLFPPDLSSASRQAFFSRSTRMT